jgi:hypothetical protein
MYGRLHLLAFGEQPNGSTDGQDTKPWWRHVKQGVLKLAILLYIVLMSELQTVHSAQQNEIYTKKDRSLRLSA